MNHYLVEAAFLVRWLIFWAYQLEVVQANELSPVIQLSDGSPVQGLITRGKSGKTVTEFWGIPFAEPPIGKLRFRKPKPNKPWRNILKATKLPNACIQTKDTQFPGFFGAEMWNANTNISEDCLYLNVWVPGRIDPKKSLTVMIWVYGGGFWSGCSTLGVYDGKILSSEENVVVVSMNYRVSLFGFLYLGMAEAPGNAGLWDQLLAFKWVRQNIQHFGGNPKDVTLFGESAGSVSVSMHVLSKQSNPYFQRAILQSGSAVAPWAMETQHELKKRSKNLAKAMKCNVNLTKNGEDDPDFGPPDYDKVLNCLLQAPTESLLEMEWATTSEFCDFPWTPVVDGVFFLESPSISLKRGNFKNTELLVGTNFDESMYFLVYALAGIFTAEKFFTTDEFITSDEMFEFAAKRTMPIKYSKSRVLSNAILFEYKDWQLPASAHRRQQALDKMWGDYHFTCSVNEFAKHYRAHGGKVFYYYFTHRATAQTWPRWMGVLHGYEINFIFGEPLNPDFNYTQEERQLARRFMRYWANFARTGHTSRHSSKRDGVAYCNEYFWKSDETKVVFE